MEFHKQKTTHLLLYVAFKLRGQGLFQGGQGVLSPPPPLGIDLPPLEIGLPYYVIWGLPPLKFAEHYAFVPS